MMNGLKLILSTLIVTFVAVGISLIIVSCTDTTKENYDTAKIQESNEYTGGMWGNLTYQIEEKTIDSCQYIILSGNKTQSIIHKPNCRNSFHNKQLNN